MRISARSHGGLRSLICTDCVTPACVSRRCMRTEVSPGADLASRVNGARSSATTCHADVGAIPCALAGESVDRARGHRVDDMTHRTVEALLGERCDALALDPTRDDVAEVAHVGRHVQREAVHRPATRQPDAYRGDLARFGAVRIDPHAGISGQPTDIGQPEVGEGIDDELLDRRHVGDGVGHPPPALAGNRQDRIADQLPGAVIGDITPAVGPDEFCTDGRGVDEHVIELSVAHRACRRADARVAATSRRGRGRTAGVATRARRRSLTRPSHRTCRLRARPPSRASRSGS